MSEAEWRAFVLRGTRTAKLATRRADGRPHVTPVWFLLDDTTGGRPQVVFTTWHASLKAKALRRSPAVALCVDDQEPPYGYVMLECTAHFTDDPHELRHWATRIGGRYMGEELAERYGIRNSVPGEYLVRATVDRVIAFGGIAD
ncbi:PPOX class F420-dependent oxidoreductase [Streptomyces sp. LP05-1]|uniref:PPOX class F420-dependent oxidoreductase n=2 Tax=Streptomyces pyxinae TaxID=2970734 RepID=A0ABT2CA61_9ACTN|nr:PPOX class F420-dependent oxidoreductase [Streptomyces sp. LP05-1]MCS0634251.1 PPOX class F420-dependent oxidoreductase [Streptomyces sp. LP05-1]